MSLLAIHDLSVSYSARPALTSVSLSVGHGEIVGIVGESGSGKSTLALAVPRLLPPIARIIGGRIELDGIDLLALDETALARVRGSGLAMVFQDPMTSFSPLLPIGRQLQAFMWRERLTARSARGRIVSMLADVGIADPERRIDSYPHELSGGMLQRVAIAAALLARPALIVADEPTTALDVTTEAQILHLLRDIRDRHGAAILVISHQLGVIAEICDRVAVMYGGTIVEEGPVGALFRRPAHPYTQALLACEPALLDGEARRLPVIPGLPPNPDLPGCRFADRCRHADAACRAGVPPLRSAGDGHAFLCQRVAA
jgi:peptide/nickel transport system ATP-binding protein